jgi:hypothetical protein
MRGKGKLEIMKKLWGVKREKRKENENETEFNSRGRKRKPTRRKTCNFPRERRIYFARY